MAQISYRPHHFPQGVIQHAVWLYLRFTLSYREVEELLAERGLDISYESVRSWVLKFGPMIARNLRRCRPDRAIDGISTKWWSGSPASVCTCGAPWIMKARFSKSWFSADGISAQPSSSCASSASRASR